MSCCCGNETKVTDDARHLSNPSPSQSHGFSLAANELLLSRPWKLPLLERCFLHGHVRRTEWFLLDDLSAAHTFLASDQMVGLQSMDLYRSEIQDRVVSHGVREAGIGVMPKPDAWTEGEHRETTNRSLVSAQFT
jgi:hypothetical protein